MRKILPGILVFLALLTLLTTTATAGDSEPHRRPDLDRLFFRLHGWVGGDGVFSVPLSPERTLWLFGDTWIGRVENGRRSQVVMVNNTIGLQSRRPFSRQRLKYFIPRSPTGKPAAFFTPPDRRGWFWPLHGIMTKRGLLVFLLRIERTEEDSAFGFQATGLWVARIGNPHEHPRRWFVSYRRVPWSRFSPENTIYWGSALLAKDKYVYIYGVSEEPRIPGCPKKLILARAPLDSADSFHQWEFWGGENWIHDFRRAAPLQNGLATEFSVTTTAASDTLLLIYSEANLTRNILAATAPAPEGPWSPPQPVFHIPDDKQNPNAFCYSGKAHPTLSRESRGTICSYVVNSLDFWDPLKHAHLYWPRFFEIPHPEQARKGLFNQ